MRSLRLLGVAVLAISGIVAVGSVTGGAGAADSTKYITVQYGGKVMKSETFTVYGETKTHFVRPVRLQYKSGDTWFTKATVNTDADGDFYFGDVTTTKSRYFRYYAPTTAGSGGESGARIIGYAKKVSVVSQSVKFFGLTPSHQCTVGEMKNLTMFAQFYPARPSRAVQFSTHQGTKTAYQDSKGSAAVSFVPGTSVINLYSASATTIAWHGAAAKSSSLVPYSQGPCF